MVEKEGAGDMDNGTTIDHMHSFVFSGTNLTSLEGVNLPADLQRLDLRFMKLPDLGSMEWPAGLLSLALSYTDLESLEGVELPLGLRELDLSFTKVTQLPELIREMRSLKSLNLSGLRLKELPVWLTELELPFTLKPFGPGICLHETTVDGVDMSVFDQSQEAILQWFEERRQMVPVPINEVKVVFLGDGGAGKSHTIARLLNDGVQTEDFPNISTPGIVISDKTYPIGDRQVQVHYWDFGGQEILHSMHRMFLTKRTLYVVMVNVRGGNQDERARYWLHNLKSFANGAPVLLVLNQMDMNRNASVNEGDLRRLYPELTEVVKLSTLTYSDEEFQKKFIDVLLEQIGSMEILDLPLIAAGRRVKEKLQNMTGSYIHGDTFRKFCDECGITGTDAVRRDLLDRFSELGVSFCYSESMKLEDYVVFKPVWITNAIYIILFNKVEEVNNGLVSHDTIYRMLTSEDTENIRRTAADAAYTREEVDFVLKVFRKFRLSFLVEGEEVEFLPMLCDANSTAVDMEYENDPNALEFRMHYEYLPNNVIHWLMVERRKELDRDNVWHKGARFVCGDTGRSAVVKSEGGMIRILVRADKDPRDPQRYLDELKEALERIGELMGLTAARMEVVYKEDGIAECFDYGRLLLAQRFSETHVLSMAHMKRVRLADVLMQSDFPEDEKQKKLMADIRQACEMLQEDSLYWNATEDQRTKLLANLLRAKGYTAMEQHRTGISAGGIQSGELDLDIRLTPGDAWSALEALNLKSSSSYQIEYWNAHLKKLLDNYNDVGRSFLFHVSYVRCSKDKFRPFMTEMHEHMRFYSPRGFELLRRFVSEVPFGLRENQNQFVRAVKCVYDCGGVTMTVYHFFVRIGE